jgi:hypothetical protein
MSLSLSTPPSSPKLKGWPFVPLFPDALLVLPPGPDPSLKADAVSASSFGDRTGGWSEGSRFPYPV